MLDAGTADAEHYASATRYTWRRRARPPPTGSTGTASYGDADSLGFGSIAVWEVATAQALLEREDRFDSISIAAKDGTSPAELVRAVPAARPEHARGQGQRRSRRSEASAQADKAMAYIRYFLLGFGGIALFVGAFVIFNTLSITVAQRTREFATLRTLGASRKQVLRSVRLEGLAIGLISARRSVSFLGFGIAKGMLVLFSADGRRPTEGRHGVRAAHRRRLAAGRHRDHAARDARARAARDPGSPDRRGPRGRGAARLAVRGRSPGCS